MAPRGPHLQRGGARVSQPQRQEALVPGAYSPRFQRMFAWYARRLVAKRFHAVRVAHGGEALLQDAARHPGPLVMAFNHTSWWDPVIGLYLHDRVMHQREPLTPMDATQLAKFKFFRKLGMFGIHPDSPEAIRHLERYVAGVFQRQPSSVLMVTPQGRFVDVRKPVVVQPGVGLVCSRKPTARVLVGALEYGFWTDQLPEVFIRVAAMPALPPVADARAWTESIQAAMQANGSALARLVEARDPAAFDTLAGGGQARIHPLYDLFLRMTGRSTAIQLDHRRPRARNAAPQEGQR